MLSLIRDSSNSHAAWKSSNISAGSIKSLKGNVGGEKRKCSILAESDENAHGNGENFSSREIIVHTYV